jgi:aryl-alcohol dehydrogenase-like predicted oxidoreductase
MQFTTLGRTGLEVSVAGLGCGGHSRLGLGTGHDRDHACRIVNAALDLGINFIDTAAAYGTERAVGIALRGKRDQVVISTKASPGWGDELLSAAALRESLEASLRRLETDYVDVFHLHGVTPGQYAWCLAELLPELQRLRDAGKIRYMGITERFVSDTRHDLLQRALPDDHFDVVMVGFNLLNPSARRSVFPLTLANRVGTLIMFAVRRALSSEAGIREVVDQLLEAGELAPGQVDAAAPLGFVAQHPEVASLIQAAYRFCRHEPGADVILTGTGSVEHLRDNVASILAPPLPPEVTARLAELFGHVESVSGN